MLLFSSIAVVLLLSSLCAGVASQSDDVTYDDIVRLNATCPRQDSCEDDRFSDDIINFNCQCGPQCVAFGTCCVDSEFRRPDGAGKGGFQCRRPYGSKKPVFMVDGCRPDAPELAREKCLGGGNNVSKEPALRRLLVPVTSSTTGHTYRNYYCYACNEDIKTSSAVVWYVKLTSNYIIPQLQSLPDLHYNASLRRWVISDLGKPVILSTEPPTEIDSLVQRCLTPIIDTCAESWTNQDTRKKCGSYTAMVATITRVINGSPMSYLGLLGTRYGNPHLGAQLKNSYIATRYRNPAAGYPKSYLGSRYRSPPAPTPELQVSSQRKVYRNPHCALCNFEDLPQLSCQTDDFEDSVGTFDVHVNQPKVPMFVGLFSLMDKERKCPRGMHWYANKCRIIRCGRGKKLERDTCVPIRGRTPLKDERRDSRNYNFSNLTEF